ncbi:unnamed protein product [Caenorhabditis auriculariae]|uniref:Protein asunder n=1 Tax=Caenorhabditis auriculariae TaxID=2777116 RepID=A0A8S1HT14_9PELO|nr:unnamed protein product [Caenorhabditis auriculariae]
MNEFDRKTVILLDATPKFAQSSNAKFALTVKESGKDAQQKNCDRLLRIAVNKPEPVIFDEEWEETGWSVEKLVEMLLMFEPPQPEDEDVPICRGITKALEALGTLTVRQKMENEDHRKIYSRKMEEMTTSERLQHMIYEADKFVSEPNVGSIVMYTLCMNDEEMMKVEAEVGACLRRKNKEFADSKKKYAPITTLNVFFVNLYPVDAKCTVTTRPLLKSPHHPALKTYVISRAVTELKNAAHSLAVGAFDMFSTTVTRIPMKEENSTSMNYDVELFHRRRAHDLLGELGVLKDNSQKAYARTGVAYESIRLAWATAPKNRAFELTFPRTLATSPCTPAEGNSRPASCLINFVMDGRCVMLDLEKTGPMANRTPNVNNYLISHTLLKHAGRIYLHAIDIREDSSKVKEKAAKAWKSTPVDELRVDSLRKLFQQVRLQRPTEDVENISDLSPKWNNLPCGNALRKLQRITRNFEIRKERTFIFQGDIIERHFQPLYQNMMKNTLTQPQMDDCFATIQRLVVTRDQRKAFALPTEQIKTSLVKDMTNKDEQLRVGLAEFARFLAAYANHSDRHLEVFQTYMRSLGLDRMLNIPADDVIPLLRIQELSDKKSSEKMSKKDDEKAKKEDPTKKRMAKAEPPPPVPEKKPVPLQFQWKAGEVVNLLDFLSNQNEQKMLRERREFVGRERPGKIARLYPNSNLAPNATVGIVPSAKVIQE